MLNELRPIKEEQHTEAAISDLAQRISTVENEMLSYSGLRSELVAARAAVRDLADRMTALESTRSIGAVSAGVDAKIKILQTRCEDAENYLRRNNLIFYGVPDAEGETWAISEKLITETCHQKLGVSFESGCIVRAHRLRSFNSSKNRPIIAKFPSSKYKDSILRVAYKMKNTGISVGEDFSPAVRQARRNLLEYGRALGKAFKIRFNRLIMGDKTFSYDSVSNTVVKDNERS